MSRTDDANHGSALSAVIAPNRLARAHEQEGELSAAIEVRRLFPGITDNAEARALRPSHGTKRIIVCR
jgi:hypothetical protein